VELASSRGFATHELTILLKIVRERREEFLNAWNDYFRG